MIYYGDKKNNFQMEQVIYGNREYKIYVKNM